nr:hypothetical protein 4 [bacterium]
MNYQKGLNMADNRENAPSRTAESGDTDQVSPQPAHLVAAKRCNARSKRHGGPCGAPAMANGKCYHHGGKNGTHPNKAHPGNKHAKKHGAFIAALQSDEEKELFQSFVDEMYKSFPDLNRSNDLAYVQIAAMSYIQLIRGIRGDAAGSTIDELSRVMNRHLTALKVNREQRDAGLLDGNGPKSPSELAILLIQKVEQREIHHLSSEEVKEIPNSTSGHVTSRIARAMQTGEFPMIDGDSVEISSHTMNGDDRENKGLEDDEDED